MDIKYIDFIGSVHLRGSHQDPLFLYHHFFLTDYDSFNSDYCLVKRKLRNLRLIESSDSDYKYSDSFDELKEVEVVRLNLKNMVLGKRIVSKINQNEAFITLQSIESSKNVIYHYIKNIEYYDQIIGGFNKNARKKVKDIKIKIIRNISTHEFNILEHHQSSSRYSLTCARNKKKLVSIKLDREECVEFEQIYLCKKEFESNSQMIYDSVMHSIIKMHGNTYIILNKAQRKSLYLTADIEYEGSLNLFTAYTDS